MRKQHFEALRPVCPVCRQSAERSGGQGWSLGICTIDREEGEHIVEGVLRCSNGACQREYPIIDGIPFLIANLRQYISDNILALYARGDLSELTESIVGDCCGVGSAFETMRQYLSSYAWDHYGDLDPEEPGNGLDGDPDGGLENGGPRPGACVRMLKAGLELAGELPEHPIIDIGCAAGRTALELAHATGQLVVGVDLHLPTLRLASGVIRHGLLSYPRRRVGLVYDRRDIAADLPGRDKVEIWACDATSLPFSRGTFGAAVGLNVLDSVRSPLELLGSIAGALIPGGAAVLSSPYDWSPAVTPIAEWVGGHSQRGRDRGSSAHILRQLLTPGALASSIPGLELEAELSEFPWHVRMHERSVVTYKSHLFVARAPSAAAVSE